MTIVWRALTGLLLVVAAGCGGSSEAEPKDPKAALEQTIDNYHAGVAEQDPEKVCTEIAPEYVLVARQQLQSEGVANPPKDCVGLWKQFFETHKEPELLEDGAEDAKFDDAEVTGETARIDYNEWVGDGGRNARTAYARRGDDGTWVITSFSD